MSKTVFLVDDDEEFLEYLRMLLGDCGYNVHSFNTGKEAVQNIMEVKPDLAILDLILPGMGGLEICKRLKLTSKTRTIPVMILTAVGSNKNWLASISHGADLFFPKPIKQDDFLACVEALLHRIPYSRENGGTLRVGGFTANPTRHTITILDRLVNDLTTKLFDLAYLLASERPHILSRKEIIRKLRMSTVRDNEVNVLVHHLRKKLGPLGKSLFKTVGSRGYHFDESAALGIQEVHLKLVNLSKAKPGHPS